MQWDKTIRLADLAIVFATLLGPVLAVQAQVYLDRARGKLARQQQIFHALMRTRASVISPEHVHALNAVPMEFLGKRKITDAYRDYIAHLNTSAQNSPEAWGVRRVDLLMDLLHKVSGDLGYDFTVAQLKGEYYAPQAHFTSDAEQTAIRQGLAKILSGQAALGMDVKNFPGDPEAQAALKPVPLIGHSHRIVCTKSCASTQRSSAYPTVRMLRARALRPTRSKTERTSQRCRSGLVTLILPRRGCMTAANPDPRTRRLSK